jgi:hypothetical protein
MADFVPVDHQPEFDAEQFVPPFLADWAKQAAGKDVGTLRGVKDQLSALATLPQRALESSAQDVQHLGEAGYEPKSIGPSVETALTMMGGGLAGVEGGGTALGSGAMRMIQNQDLYKELANLNRAKGWATGKSAEGWNFKRPDEAKGSFARAAQEARSNFAGDVDKAKLEYAQVAPGNPLMSPEDWAHIDENIKRGGPAFTSGATDKKTAAMMQAIRAYHGSPHDFDRFDLSKIGTGEGAQAYGHGLYFAENPEVAGSYRITPNQKTMNGPANELVAKAGGDWKKALENYDAWLSDMTSSGFPRTEAQDQVRAALAKGNEKGRMYEVNINADPEHFLDWDKPLGEQSPQVKALEDAYWTQHAKRQPDIRNFLQSPQGAEEARKAGIPGIKYLDQGSRFQPQQVEHLQNQISGLENLLKQRPGDENVMHALEGRRQELASMKPTSNYVVFDDKLIDILRKYGIAGLPAGGVAAGAMQSQPSNADMVSAIRGQQGG